jgi:hypothetical protein
MKKQREEGGYKKHRGDDGYKQVEKETERSGVKVT